MMTTLIDWKDVDCIELATVGVDREQPVATGNECVERIDGDDPDAYEFRSHSVYVHRQGIGATCIADCWDRDVARQLGTALARALKVPVDDETVDMGDAALAVSGGVPVERDPLGEALAEAYALATGEAPAAAAGTAAAPASSWWLVTCRLDGADEDSCWCFYVASEAAAVAAAEAEERSNEDEDERALPVEERTPFYVNHVVNCGQVEPTIVRTP
jgi:hypothetical protein